jgi:hypothetical protein
MSKEGMLSILKKMERSDSTLRHSAVRYSIFCGSLFDPGHLQPQQLRRLNVSNELSVLRHSAANRFPG